MKKKKLYKIEQGRKVFGVCGGIAEYFDMDATVIRLIWVLAVFCFGTGLLAYLIAALIMPNESDVIKVIK